MENDNIIYFPDEERMDLIEKINKDGFLLTTRFDKEEKKYKKGEEYITEWGQKLKVKEVVHYNDLRLHPFLSELSKDQVILLSQYKTYAVVRLEKVEMPIANG